MFYIETGTTQTRGMYIFMINNLYRDSVRKKTKTNIKGECLCVLYHSDFDSARCFTENIC